MNMDYTCESFENIDKWLKEHLEEERYLHSLGTMQCAKELAQKFSLDEKKAQTAALLHDCAKCFSNQELREIIETKLPNVDKSELLNYKTLHAPVSAYIAEQNFGVTDKEILSAIRWHTLGKCDMSDFEKLFFLQIKLNQICVLPNTERKCWRF